MKYLLTSLKKLKRKCVLKIIAGKHRGRNIETAPSKDIRPTTSFAREGIFNILMHGRFGGEKTPLVGKRVVDLFCGSGALGFEALSRGAAHVTFIDQNPKALELVKKTAMTLGETNHAAFIRSDSTHVPRAVLPCSLAFVDPPYDKALAVKGIESLISGGWLEDKAIVVVEQSKKEMLVPPASLTLLDERSYGIARISILIYSL